MLPTIEIPRFETVLPSTKKKIEFRPYLVKEEKILMIASESKDEKQILKAIKDMVRACTFDKINPDDLTVFDLEYLFLKLRAKSVGESSKIKLKCEACASFTDTSINLDEIEPTIDPGFANNRIMLTDDIGVTIKLVSVRAISRIDLSDKGNSVNRVMELLAASIETVFDKKGVYAADTLQKDELGTFIDSLNRQQLGKIEEYIKLLPKLEKTIEFKCSKCEKENSIILSGLQSFFT